MSAHDAWVLSRILTGLPVEGVKDVSRSMRPLAERLLVVGASRREAILDGFATAQDDPDLVVQAVLDADPDGPAPARDVGSVGATLADVRRLQSDRSWPWLGWMPRGALTALASDPGVGKTLLAMTLSRDLWEGRPMPDGQSPTAPPRTRTLWIAGDHHFGQLTEVAEAYGLPPESMLLNGTVADPTGGMFLDDPEALRALADRVADESPGLVVIDTVGMTTDRNLGRAEEARGYFQSLMKIAMKSGTPFLLLTHLSKDANALGRRIVGACRVVWKLTRPDPDNQPDRRRLWVDKSYAVVPPPLGMTIAAHGCTFDTNPPVEPPGAPVVVRTSPRREACRRWLLEALTPIPVRAKDLRVAAERAGFSTSYLYVAVKDIGAEEYVVDGRKWWRLPDAP